MTDNIAQGDILYTEIDQLITALAQAQTEMPSAEFDMVNPHFKSRYASLASIRKASIAVLSKHGLALTQFTYLTPGGGELRLITLLAHKSGQWIRSEYPIVLGTPQSMGSQLTYARRYMWSAITGVTADEDDDAEVAEASKDVPRATEKKTAHAARPDWEPMLAEMKMIKSAPALRVWRQANNERLNAWPRDWVKRFDDLIEARVDQLVEELRSAKEPDNGKSPLLKQQLKASLQAEEGEAD